MTDFIKVENLVFDYIKSEDRKHFSCYRRCELYRRKGKFHSDHRTEWLGEIHAGKEHQRQLWCLLQERSM